MNIINTFLNEKQNKKWKLHTTTTDTYQQDERSTRQKKNAELLQEKRKKKQNIKLIAICFDVVFSDFLTIKELMAKQLPKKEKKKEMRYEIWENNNK